jgi:hypothetical protein
LNVRKESDTETAATPPRLGFQEIVPGAPDADLCPEHQVDIPQFDLNQHSMTELRKQVAARRRGPGRKSIPADQPETPTDGIPLPDRAFGLAPLLAIEPHPVIAQLVQRDIRKLCQGNKVFH